MVWVHNCGGEFRRSCQSRAQLQNRTILSCQPSFFDLSFRTPCAPCLAHQSTQARCLPPCPDGQPKPKPFAQFFYFVSRLLSVLCSLILFYFRNGCSSLISFSLPSFSFFFFPSTSSCEFIDPVLRQNLHFHINR